MCTVMTNNEFHLLGRTMDFPPRTPWKLTYLPVGYKWRPAHSTAVISNRRAILGSMRVLNKGGSHYLIGDGINDQGLFCAELFFPVAADYGPESQAGGIKLTPQDFIGWVLGQHRSISELKNDLCHIAVVGKRWYDQLLYPFHWLLMDKTGTYVIEPLGGHLCLRRNPSGVFTNTPELTQQITRLNHFLGRNSSTFDQGTIAAIKKSRQAVPDGGNSVQRFIKAAVWRWQCPPADHTQMLDFLQAVTIPQVPEHAHNYTHYQAVVDQRLCKYEFHDLHTGQVTTADLPWLMTHDQQVKRYD
jgi:penicillin V acylase-like amidase (Ntn superfamily)